MPNICRLGGRENGFDANPINSVSTFRFEAKDTGSATSGKELDLSGTIDSTKRLFLINEDFIGYCNPSPWSNYWRMYKPRDIYGSVNIDCKTSFFYTGLDITIPASNMFAIYVVGGYDYSAPNGICLSTNSSTMDNVYNRLAYSETSRAISFAGKTPSFESLTIHVWARYASAAKNHIYVHGWHKPLI